MARMLKSGLKKAKRNKKMKVPNLNRYYDSLMFPSMFWDTKPAKVLPVTHVAVYKEMTDGEDYRDGWDTFTSLKDLKEWVKKDKNATDIKYFTVAGELVVTKRLTFRKKKK